MSNLQVYEAYFGLSEHPFSITPDPRFVYLSESHRVALEHLESGAAGGVNGFVLLTGDVGTGKTTICRTFLEKVPPRTEVALILNPVLTLNEFLQTICDELDLVIDGSRTSNKNLMEHLNRFLLQVYAMGQRTILIIDEAQNLSQELLEQIRLLTNLETATDKLLQIFLIGQPELRDMLGRPEMTQVSQRITSRYHIGPLSAEDTAKYVKWRLEVAGASAELDFRSSALRRIHAFSNGVPRVINVLCDKALRSAYENGTMRVDAKIVKDAERRMVGNLPAASQPARRGSGVAVTAVLVLAALLSLAGAYLWDVGGLRQWADPRLARLGVDVPVATTEMQAGPAEAPVAVTRPGDAPASSAPSAEPAVVETDAAKLPVDASSTGASDEAAGPMTSAGVPPQSLPEPLPEPADPLVDAQSTGVGVSAPNEAGVPAPAAENADTATTSPPATVPPADPSPPKPVVTEAPARGAAPGVSVAETGAAPPATSVPRSSRSQPPLAAATPAPQQSLADYTRSYAERKLLSMWGIAENESMGPDFCQVAGRHGLRCHNESSGLPGLYRYDRPAIIFLTIDNVSSYAVVLKASTADVVLDVLGREHVIPASSLADVWDGSFLLLWKQPQGVGNYLKEGATGPSALWLRRAVDRIEGTSTTGNTYDADLVARVKRFQRSVGLTPDGIVGPRTFILLQNKLAE